MAHNVEFCERRGSVNSRIVFRSLSPTPRESADLIDGEGEFGKLSVFMVVEVSFASVCYIDANGSTDVLTILLKIERMFAESRFSIVSWCGNYGEIHSST